MKSVIKTNLSFSQQLTELKGNGDVDFLIEFIKHCHKNADYIQIDVNTFQVTNKRKHYIYTCYATYIMQINQRTNARTFFKICQP